MPPLTGPTIERPGGDETRVPINIDSEVRDRLRMLLYHPKMRGVGYSEFILRAVSAAYAELEWLLNEAAVERVRRGG